MNQAIYYFISINLDCMLFLQVVTWNTNIQRVPEISKTYKIRRNVNSKLLIDKQKPNFCDKDCYTVSLPRRLITVTIVVIPPLRFSERLGFRIFKFPWSARAGSTRLSNKRKKNTPFQHSIDARTRTPGRGSRNANEAKRSRCTASPGRIVCGCKPCGCFRSRIFDIDTYSRHRSFNRITTRSQGDGGRMRACVAKLSHRNLIEWERYLASVIPYARQVGA